MLPRVIKHLPAVGEACDSFERLTKTLLNFDQFRFDRAGLYLERISLGCHSINPHWGFRLGSTKSLRSKRRIRFLSSFTSINPIASHF